MSFILTQIFRSLSIVWAYGLNVKSVHWEPDEKPGPEMWKQLQTLMDSRKAKHMMWEDRPLTETVEKLKALGITSIVLAPCGNSTGAGDFLSTMRSNINNLAVIPPK